MIMKSVLGQSRVGRMNSMRTNASRSLATVTLPDLPYDYAALEPYISAEIMELHHSKHHQAYVNNYNKALEQEAEAEDKKDNAGMLALQGALKFNGGGCVNHSIFWKNLCPSKDFEPLSGPLLDAINTEFGSQDDFVAKFNAAAAGVQGSGWAWLGYDKSLSRLEIATSPNQDLVPGLVPLLGVDVWEHAYYLQYKNVRPDYLKAIWNVVNWKDVSERYASAQA